MCFLFGVAASSFQKISILQSKKEVTIVVSLGENDGNYHVYPFPFSVAQYTCKGNVLALRLTQLIG